MSRTWLAVGLLVGWFGLGNTVWAQSFYRPAEPAPMTPSGGDPTSPWQPGLLPFNPMNFGENAFSEDFNPPSDPNPGRCHLGVDYLILWFKPVQPSIPLITLGDVNDAIPGAMGQSGTQIMYGTDKVCGTNAAGRFSFAWAFDPEVVCFEANYWIMEQRSHIFGVSGTGDPNSTAVIARPYFNPNFNLEDADPRVIPAFMAGTAQSQFTTRMMGAETNLRWHLTGYPGATGFTLLAGARFLKLDEKYIGMDTAVDLPLGTGNTYQFMDNITTYNEFVGGQLGLQFKCVWERWSLDTQTKLAAGPNFRRVSYTGFTSITNNTGSVIADNFGTYVQPSNRGVLKQQTWTLMPELSFNLGYYLTSYLRLWGGYSFLYLAHVSRPDNQFDHVVNIQPLQSPTQVGPARPRPPDATSDFWVQWLNLGLEVVF